MRNRTFRASAPELEERGEFFVHPKASGISYAIWHGNRNDMPNLTETYKQVFAKNMSGITGWKLLSPPDQHGDKWYVYSPKSASKTPFLVNMTQLPPVWQSDEFFKNDEVSKVDITKDGIPYPETHSADADNWKYCQIGAHASAVFSGENGQEYYLIFQEIRRNNPLNLSRQFGGSTDKWKTNLVITFMDTIFKEFWEETGFQHIFDKYDITLDAFGFIAICKQLSVRMEKYTVLRKSEKTRTYMKVDDLQDDDLIIEQKHQLHSKWEIHFPAAKEENAVSIIRRFMEKNPDFEFNYTHTGMDNFSGWAIVDSSTHKAFVKTKGFTATDDDLRKFDSIKTGTKEEWEKNGMPLPSSVKDSKNQLPFKASDTGTDVYFINRNIPDSKNNTWIAPIVVSSWEVETEENVQFHHVPFFKIMPEDLHTK